MNNQFQFISYTPTPNDQYMLGIAKVKLYGKVELRYKHVKTKDGNGSFFTSATYTTTDPQTNEKKYIPCFLVDSRSDEEMLQEVIRSGVNQVLQQRSVQIPNIAKSLVDATVQAIHYPHGLVTNQKEVAESGECPF